MKTQTAILIGFAFLAISNLFSPVVSRLAISPAMAGELDMVEIRLAQIANAIEGIQNCR